MCICGREQDGWCALTLERYQHRSNVKLSLLDLPFLPDEMRDLLAGANPVPLARET
jgi:hypothetical protein